MARQQVVSPALRATARAVLALLRDRLGLSTCLLAIRDEDDYRVLEVLDSAFGLSPGRLAAWSDSLCAGMALGEIPSMVPDVLAEPAAAERAARLGLPVRAYAGTPLRDRSGRLVGSLCAVSATTASPNLLAQQDLLSTLGALLGDLLALELGAGHPDDVEGSDHLGGGDRPARGGRLPAPRPEADPLAWEPDAGVDAAVTGLLDRLRGLFGLEVAFVSRLTAHEQRFTHVSKSLPVPLIVGGRRPRESSLCQRVLDGRLPRVLVDARQHENSRDLDVVQAGLVGAYLTVPVVLPSGEPFGTLCCLSPRPRPDLGPDAAAALAFAAEQVGVLLGGPLGARARRTAIGRRVEELLRTGGLRLALQPVVDLASGRVAGYETLSRFDDGRSPELWYAEASDGGRGERLELAAVDLSLALADTLVPEAFLAVNVSPPVALSGGLRDRLGALQRHRPALLRRLVLELTEHQQVADYTALDRALAPWRRAGLRLSIDDTGAGYSTLAHVLRLRPDVIKLDRHLVTEVDSDPIRRGLVASLQGFCAGSGIALIAEGVETAAEARALAAAGVRLGQGYHLGRPLLHRREAAATGRTLGP